jgi:hypothetical protein
MSSLRIIRQYTSRQTPILSASGKRSVEKCNGRDLAAGPDIIGSPRIAMPAGLLPALPRIGNRACEFAPSRDLVAVAQAAKAGFQ